MAMRLDEVLAAGDPALLSELGPEELRRFFWKYKGLEKQYQRDIAFWQASNENLKLAYEKLDEQERELSRAYQIIREDLSVAHQIQSALLPRILPQMAEELEVAVYHKQLTEVGGDYYDFFPLPGDRYAIGMLDISGHGVSAALIMAFLKAQFVQVMKLSDSPKTIVEWVNQTSLSFLREVRRYATVNLVAVDTERLRYVSGGGYGLLVHPGGEHHSFAKGNSFLGLRPKSFTEHELAFAPGDLLVLYTDGIIEAQDQHGHDYTSERLHRLVLAHRDRGVQEIVERCVEDYAAFRKADGDDVTLLVLRRR